MFPIHRTFLLPAVLIIILYQIHVLFRREKHLRACLENGQDLFSPKFSFDETTKESLKASNSSKYTWIGNNWIPPKGVPIFSAREIKAYFRNRNVLVIGDSTSRRFYGTLFSILNATDVDDILVNDINAETMLNENKKGSKTSICPFTRGLVSLPGNKWATCKNLGQFKFDHMVQYCFEFIDWFWSNKTNHLSVFSNEYDIVIIAIGVWEINKPQFCSQNSPNTTVQQRVDSTIENIFKNNPKNLKVAIRTSGFDERFQNKDKTIFDINSIEREKFMGKNTGDVCLVDWGSVILKRSFGDRKIKGDHPAHYELEARLLFIQQLLHEFIKSDILISEKM